MDWLKALYELVGVPFPRLSLAVAALIGAVLLSGAWWLVGRQYRRDQPPTTSSGQSVQSRETPGGGPATSGSPERTDVGRPAAGAPRNHQDLPSRLARGWTLHKTGETWSIYFMVDTTGLEEVLRPEVQRGNQSLDQLGDEVSANVRLLWQELTAGVPRPDPPRTPLGPVPADLTEHINHTFDAGDVLNWNYEYLRAGTAVKAVQPIPVALSKLSEQSTQTVAVLDRLASEAVNRSYVEAIQRLTAR